MIEKLQIFIMGLFLGMLLGFSVCVFNPRMIFVNPTEEELQVRYNGILYKLSPLENYEKIHGTEKFVK
jgi:hypothetical protein